MAAGTRLAIGATIVLSITAYWTFVGASSSWQYYLTVDEYLACSQELKGNLIRVSGMISPQSLRIADDRLGATFRLVGERGELLTRCKGTVPDNLAEGLDVVVEGWVDSSGELLGDKVLTRCASKYSSASRRARPNLTSARLAR